MWIGSSKSSQTTPVQICSHGFEHNLLETLFFSWNQPIPCAMGTAFQRYGWAGWITMGMFCQTHPLPSMRQRVPRFRAMLLQEPSALPQRDQKLGALPDTNPIFPRPNLVPDLYVPHLYGPWVASFRLWGASNRPPIPPSGQRFLEEPHLLVLRLVSSYSSGEAHECTPLCARCPPGRRSSAIPWMRSSCSKDVPVPWTAWWPHCVWVPSPGLP